MNKLTDRHVLELAQVAAVMAEGLTNRASCEVAHVSLPVPEGLKGLDVEPIIFCSIRTAPRGELARIYDDVSKDDAAFLLFFDRFERAFTPLVEGRGKVCRLSKELPNLIVIFPALEPFDKDHVAPPFGLDLA